MQRALAVMEKSTQTWMLGPENKILIRWGIKQQHPQTRYKINSLDFVNQFPPLIFDTC